MAGLNAQSDKDENNNDKDKNNNDKDGHKAKKKSKNAFDIFRRGNITKLFGNYKLESGAIPYANEYNLFEKKLFLRDYVRYIEKADKEEMEDPHCTFTKYEHFRPKSLEHSVFPLSEIPFLNESLFKRSSDQFFVGSALSGAPVHYHGSALNLLVYGRKRWFLFPPSKAFYSVTHPHKWYRDHYNTLPEHERPIELIQEAGDVLYVPQMWGHSVLNLGTAVGVATEYEPKHPTTKLIDQKYDVLLARDRRLRGYKAKKSRNILGGAVLQDPELLGEWEEVSRSILFKNS